MDFIRKFEPDNLDIPEFIPKGAYEAYLLLKKETDKGKDAKILVYGDPDIDGLMSQEMMQLYLKQLGIFSQYYLNSNRSHGFKIDYKKLEKLKGGLIIAVDFSIPYEDFVKILDMGINVIVIDHHEISVSDYTNNVENLNSFVYKKSGDAYGVILNNQYSFEPKGFRFLSGAGMVYYFIKFISGFYEVPLYSDYGAMAGISLLSDIRELENYRAKKFLKYTFTHESNFMSYLIWIVTDEARRTQGFSSFGVARIARDFVDFTFSPVFNALLRADEGDACVRLLKGDESTFREMTYANRILTFRSKQKTIIADIGKYVDQAKLQPGTCTKEFDNMIVCVIPDDFETTYPCHISNYIGVACSQIKDEYKTGVIFVIDNNTREVIRGSVRGGADGVDYLSIFRNNGIGCAGHHNAFGITECDIDNVDFEKISEEIREAELENERSNKGTRKVMLVNNLGMFMKGHQSKMVANINEYVRDNHRIFIKYTGDSKIVCNKKTDKYASYTIDGTEIKCFDPSLSVKEDFLLLTFENGKYVNCTLRKAFDYSSPLSTQEFAEFNAKLNEDDTSDNK